MLPFWPLVDNTFVRFVGIKNIDFLLQSILSGNRLSKYGIFAGLNLDGELIFTFLKRTLTKLLLSCLIRK